MINEKLLEQIENYIDTNFIDFEAAAKQGIKFSYSSKTDFSDEIGTTEKIIRTLKNIIGMSGNYFSDYLWKIIAKKNITDVEVYKKAHLDRRVFSKIRNEKDYMPSKKTVLAIAIALELNYEETLLLLHRAGHHLTMGNKEDVIIEYFIENRIYDFFLINEVLDHYGFKPFG